MLTRMILVTLLNIFLCVQNISASENFSTQEDSRIQWFGEPPSPKIIPSETYPSWEESFYENILCQKDDCGLLQKGPRFFILEEQKNHSFLL